MATGTVHPAPVPPPLPAAAPSPTARPHLQVFDRQLGRTRFHVKLVDLLSRLAILTVGVLGFLLVMAVVDHWWIWPLGTWGRVLAFVALFGGVAYYLVTQISPLFLRRINETYAARAIEESQPSLKNSLINFLLLRSDRSQVREVIFEAIEQRAASDIANVPIESAVDRSHLIRVGYVLLGVLTLCAAYKILSPKDPFQTFARVVAPWADISRPARVQISNVQPGDAKIYRGRSATISAELHGVREGMPVTLVYSTADGQTVNREVAMKPGPGGVRFDAQLPPLNEQGLPESKPGLQQDVIYRVVAGDAVTSDYRLTVVDAPTMVVEKIELEFPAYTRKARQSLPQGDIRALEGTKVTIHAKANQPIQSAVIEFDPVASSPPAGVKGTATGAKISETIPLQFDGQKAWGTITLLLSSDRATPWHGSYQVRFTNAEGQKSEEPVVHPIEVIRDLPPEVQILAPAKRVVEVPENGSLKMEIRGIDPDYALSKLAIEGTSKGKVVLDRQLLDQAAASPQAVAQFLFRPAEHQLVAGDEMTWRAIAADNRVSPVTGAAEPNEVATADYLIKVTAPLKPENSQNTERKPGEPNPMEGDPPPEKRPGEGNSEKQPKAGEKPPMPGEQQPGQKNPMPRPGEQKPGEKQPGEKQEPGEKPMQSSEEKPGEKGTEQKPGEKSKEPKQGEKGSQGQEGSKSEQKQGESQSGGSEQKRGQEQNGGAGGASSEGGGEKPMESQGGTTSSGTGGKGSEKPEQGAKPTGSGATSGEGTTGQSGDNPEQQTGEGAEGATGTSQSGGEAGKPSKAEHEGDAIEKILEHRQQRESKSGVSGKPAAGEKGSENPTREQPQDGPMKSGEPGAQDTQTTGQPKSGQPKPGEKGAEKSAAKGSGKGAEGAPAEGAKGQEQQGPPKEGPMEGAPGQPSETKSGETKPGEKGAGSQGEKKTEGAKGGNKPEEGKGAGGEKGSEKGPMNAGERSPMPGAGAKSGEKKRDPQKGTEQQPGASGAKSGEKSPQDKPSGEGKPKEAGEGSSGSKPQGPKPAGEEKGAKGAANEKKEPGAGKNGESGAASPTNDKQGSGESQADNRDTKKFQKGEKGEPQKNNEPSPPSKSKKQSDSKGENSGNESGGGKKGAGQGGQQAGNEKPGSNSVGDEGANSAPEEGKGKTGDSAGDDQKSSGAEGAAGEKSKSGTDSRQNPAGDQPGAPMSDQPPGSERGEGPEGQKNAAKGSTGNKSGSSQAIGGGQPGERQPKANTSGETTEADKANLEYARKATDMALEHLRDQQHNPDQELLDRLGWTKDELQEFVRRWEAMEKAAKADPKAQRELDESLRSLGLRPAKNNKRSGGGATDNQRDLRDSGSRSSAPGSYREQFEQYRKGAGR